MIYTTLFTAALAISSTAVASPFGNKYPPPGPGYGFAPPNKNKFPPPGPGNGFVPPNKDKYPPPGPGNGFVPPNKDKYPPPPFTSTDDAPPTDTPPTDIPPIGQDHKYKTLGEWAKHHNRFWGVAVDKVVMEKPGIADFVAKEFNSVTPENSMKWNVIEPKMKQYFPEDADYLVKFAQEHNMMIRGHAALWFKQLSEYVAEIKDPETMKNAIREHVTYVVGRWKGIIQVWDVVNEILEQDGSLRASPFSRVLGEEFVIVAFDAAHKADPDARLYINDFNLDDPNCPKTKGMIAKVDKWIKQGVKISGIGTQSHIEGGSGPRHAAALKALAAVVPEVAITELDITNAPVDDYVAVVKGCLDVPGCVSITSWGVNDHFSWLSGKNPLLFDSNLRPKKAYDAIMSTP